MSTKRLLTVFGATGNQGGSVIDVVLARPEISAKYALRGVSRDPSSSKSKDLSSKGVEVVHGDLNDLDSLKAALKGSYGVFGLTDFWSLRTADPKATEIQQGKNIFLAAQAAGVKHYVWSALPDVTKLSGGKYTHVQHFDSKALVREFIEENKGEMIASYYMPAMFLSFLKQGVQNYNGTPTLSMPFTDLDKPWPLVAPRRDGGKYVMGLFEAGEKANGVAVQGVSTWTTANAVVKEVGEFLGKEMRFNKISGEQYGSYLPEVVREDLTEMMLWIGEQSYYGEGSEKEQKASAEFLIKDADLVDMPTFLKEGGKWEV